MLTSLIRFAFISFLFSSAAAFSADNASISTEPKASQAASQPTANTQLPEWFYRELTSIRKDVSVLDATGASKEQIQELKERIGKVEVRLEESQLRVDGKLNEQSGRIGDIYASTDRFGIIVSWVAGGISLLLLIASFLTASGKAKSETEKHVREWLEHNKKTLNEQLEKAKTRLDETVESEIVSAKKQIDDFVMSGKKNIERIQSTVNELQNRVEKISSKIMTDSFTDKGSESEYVSSKKIEVINDGALLIKEESSSQAGIQPDVTKVLDDSALADSLFSKALSLNRSKHLEEANEVYDEIIKRFRSDNKLEIQEMVAKSLINKANTLDALLRRQEAIEVYDEIINRFKNNEEPTIQKRVVKALANKGTVLSLLGRFEEAVLVYDDVDLGFGHREEPGFQRTVARALVNKGAIQGQLKGLVEEISVYDDVIKRFGESLNSDVLDAVIQAFINKAVVLEDMKDFQEALKIYNYVIERFGESQEAIIKEQVAKTLEMKGRLEKFLKR
ncbi:tetratricopeptide repeat protein [Marinomonas polaris]|uniref:tetratricopeptide repeat protein n=1 Tax=Marinomonas polaris TaxID=293552 RepID=UPI003F96661C